MAYHNKDIPIENAKLDGRKFTFTINNGAAFYELEIEGKAMNGITRSTNRGSGFSARIEIIKIK